MVVLISGGGGGEGMWIITGLKKRFKRSPASKRCIILNSFQYKQEGSFYPGGLLLDVCFFVYK